MEEDLPYADKDTTYIPAEEQIYLLIVSCYELGFLWYEGIWFILRYFLNTCWKKPWQNMIGERVAPE
jgi:hypothetical protein